MSRRGFLRGLAAMGLLPGSLSGATPLPPEPLRILKETFGRPLPSRFTARSKLSWPGGVVTGQYEFHGSPKRCIIRSSLLSVGRFQGAPQTVHARRVVLYGGSWIDEKLGVDPSHPSGCDALVLETFLAQREDLPRSPVRLDVLANRSTTFDPRPTLAGIGIAFGYRHQTVFPELTASHPDETITVRPGWERIDGAETIVIQFASAAQRRTLWLDPQQAMLPRRVEIEVHNSDVQPVGGAHRFIQSFCDDFPHGRHALYHGFRFERVGGHPWIIGYRAEYESEDQEGNALALQGEYNIQNLEVDATCPTEEEVSAAIDLPADTSVNVHLPEGEGQRIGVWQGGRVLPAPRIGVGRGGGGGGFF